MKKWVIVGCHGQLGTALRRQLTASPDTEVVAAVDLPELDAADAGAVKALFQGLCPDVVVNAAAFTHVDRCEREPEEARRANTVAPGLLAEACDRANCQMVHVSTDYIFPGGGSRPYREEDPTGPVSVYGRSKLEGEARVRAVSSEFLVVRTSWVFGRGRNFLAAILNQASARERGDASGPLRVVDDQRGRPTYAEDLSSGIRMLTEQGARGLFHLAGGGEATWWELARYCLDAAGHAAVPVERIRTSDLELDAPRPAYSVLDCSKAEKLGVRLRGWREAVSAYLRSSDRSEVVA